MLKFKGMFRAIVFIACVVIGTGILRSISTLSQKKGIFAERQQVLTLLTEKNRQLQEDLREATSAAFVEQAARDKLGLVREGETVVIMDKSQGANSNKATVQELPPWKQWWQLFF
jgi:cell division protein DivIC